MKIAFFLPDLGGGGAQKMTLNLAAELAGRGNAVSLVLASRRGAYADEPVPEGVTVVDLGCPRTLFALPGLAGFLRRERPDVLVSALFHANAVAILARIVARAGTKLVVTERNYFSERIKNSEKPADRLYPYALRALYPLADAVVGISDGVAADIARAAGLPAGKVLRIYNPVVTPAFGALAGEAVPDPWLDDPSVPVVIASGRLVEQKDYPVLIKAFARLRKRRTARLMILGTGDEAVRRRLDQLLALMELKDDVRFCGFVRNPLALMSKARVFAMASRWEGFCNVIVEALYCGLPVVATDCPSGPAEILEGGRFGRLVPVGDEGALAAALEAALDDKPDRKRLRERAMAFSASAIADEYMSLFELLCGGSLGAP